MTMPKCRDCRHWLDDSLTNIRIKGYKAKRCETTTYSDEVDNGHIVYVIDFENRAWLYTSAEFGCNRFEAKDGVSNT